MMLNIRSGHPKYVASYALLRAQQHDAVLEMVDRSLAQAVDSDQNWTLLHVAAYHGSDAVAKALLAAGANPDTQDNKGETPMHLAAKWPHDKVAAYLVDYKCDVNMRNKRQRTPLHTAALFQRRGVLEILLRAGADVNVQDDQGDTPLHLALRNNGGVEPEVGRLLLRCKPKLHLVNNKGQPPLSQMQNAEQAVFYAVNEGLAELMEVLVGRGAPVDVIDVEGLTLLQRAAFRGDAPMVKVLLAAGAKVNQQVEGKWSPSPFAIDTTYGAPAATPNRPPLGDRSALHFAAERGNREVLELLIAGGAKVNNVGNAGLISPLHIAVWTGQAESVRVLLEHKADVKARVAKNGMTPLHFAVNSALSKVQIVSLLVKAGADVEDRCAENWTPLMLACRAAPADVVEYLLLHGARLAAKGRRGLTAIDCAEGRPDVLKVLGAHCQVKGLTELSGKIRAAEQRIKKYGGALTAARGDLVPPDAGIGVTATMTDGSTIPLSLTGSRVEGESLVLDLAVPPFTALTGMTGPAAGAGAGAGYAATAQAAGSSSGAASDLSASARLQLQQRELSRLLSALTLPASSPVWRPRTTGTPSATVTVEPSTSSNTNTNASATPAAAAEGSAGTQRAGAGGTTGASGAGASNPGRMGAATIDILNLLGLGRAGARPRGQRLRTKPVQCAMHSVGGGKSKVQLVAGVHAGCQQDPSGGQILESDKVITLGCSQQCTLKFHAACWKEVVKRLKTSLPAFTISQTAEHVPCIRQGCLGVVTEVTMSGLTSPLYSFKCPEGTTRPGAPAAVAINGAGSSTGSAGAGSSKQGQGQEGVVSGAAAPAVPVRACSPPVGAGEASTSAPAAAQAAGGGRRPRKSKSTAGGAAAQKGAVVVEEMVAAEATTCAAAAPAASFPAHPSPDAGTKAPSRANSLSASDCAGERKAAAPRPASSTAVAPAAAAAVAGGKENSPTSQDGPVKRRASKSAKGAKDDQKEEGKECTLAAAQEPSTSQAAGGVQAGKAPEKTCSKDAAQSQKQEGKEKQKEEEKEKQAGKQAVEAASTAPKQVSPGTSKQTSSATGKQAAAAQATGTKGAANGAANGVVATVSKARSSASGAAEVVQEMGARAPEVNKEAASAPASTAAAPSPPRTPSAAVEAPAVKQQSPQPSQLHGPGVPQVQAMVQAAPANTPSDSRTLATAMVPAPVPAQPPALAPVPQAVPPILEPQHPPSLPAYAPALVPASRSPPLPAPVPAAAPAPSAPVALCARAQSPPAAAPVPVPIPVLPATPLVDMPVPVQLAQPAPLPPAAAQPSAPAAEHTPDARLKAAVQLLQLPAGHASPHVLLQCADIAWIARTPGMMDAWLNEHVVKGCGALEAYRLLGSFGMVALTLESPAVAAAVLQKLHGHLMLMSPIEAAHLVAFLDNALLVQAAQRVAMQVGGEGWLDLFTEDCNHVKTLPAATLCRGVPAST